MKPNNSPDICTRLRIKKTAPPENTFSALNIVTDGGVFLHRFASESWLLDLNQPLEKSDFLEGGFRIQKNVLWSIQLLGLVGWINWIVFANRKTPQGTLEPDQWQISQLHFQPWWLLIQLHPSTFSGYRMLWCYRWWQACWQTDLLSMLGTTQHKRIQLTIIKSQKHWTTHL